MKTILIPTDFSDCAKNAANFALNFAKKEKIQFILFNALFFLPPLWGFGDVLLEENLGLTPPG